LKLRLVEIFLLSFCIAFVILIFLSVNPINADYLITFSQTGIDLDFDGIVVIIDGTPYSKSALPISFCWSTSSIHNFSFQSSLIVEPNLKRYIWNSTTGMSALQSDSITVSTWGSVVGNYKTQFFLHVASPYATSSGQGWHYNGSAVYAILNTDTESHGNGTQRVFTSWGGNASGTDYSQSDPITMDGPKTAIASWKTQYYLKLTTGSGGIVDPSSSNWYDTGTIVSVTATPDTYHLFDHWELDSIDVGSDNPYNVTMDTAHTLHAVFVQEMSTLTITTTPGGTTDPSPSEHAYPVGINVTVTAIPDEHYVLDHWELDSVDVGSANPYTIFLNSNHTLHAVFTLTNYTLTINVAADGITNPTAGVYTYTAETNVFVLAVADTDYDLDRWLLDGSNAGDANPIYILIDGDHELKPVFVYAPPPTPPPSLIVGGSTASISYSLVHAWIILNVVLVTAIIMATSWKKGRKNGRA